MKIWTLLCIAGFVISSQAAEVKNAAQALPVRDISFSTLSEGRTPVVTVLGEVKNTTAKTVSNLALEAVLLDTSGKVIDVINERSYDVVIPSGESVSLKLQGRSAAALDNYAAAKLRVVSANTGSLYPDFDDTPSETPPKQKDSLWINLLVSWGPMLLLIGIWMFVIRRYNGKNSYQAKLLKAMDEQTELLAKQSAAVEALAKAIQERSQR